MTVTQSSDRAVINWQSFSIGEGSRVDIRQPDARSALLNRVTGDTTSTIAGSLNANGQVFLINPNRSEEHTSELQSLMRISYAVFCLKKKNKTNRHTSTRSTRYI